MFRVLKLKFTSADDTGHFVQYTGQSSLLILKADLQLTKPRRQTQQVRASELVRMTITTQLRAANTRNMNTRRQVT